MLADTIKITQLQQQKLNTNPLKTLLLTFNCYASIAILIQDQLMLIN